MKRICKPQKFLYNTMVNPPASTEQFFLGKEIPEGGRVQTAAFGWGWSLINSEIYSIWAVRLYQKEVVGLSD